MDQFARQKICRFQPVKAGLKGCTERVDTEWGFCKKHKDTIQSINARKLWEKQKEEQQKKAKQVVRKIVIRPNKWGKYEEPKTHILFDPKTKYAYGVQDPSGRVRSLTSTEVVICEKNRWKYVKKGDSEDEDTEEEEQSEEEEEQSEEEEEDEEEQSEEEEEEEEEQSEEEEEEQSEEEEEDEDDYDSDSD
jgi:hypothetical protein